MLEFGNNPIINIKPSVKKPFEEGCLLITSKEGKTIVEPGFGKTAESDKSRSVHEFK